MMSPYGSDIAQALFLQWLFALLQSESGVSVIGCHCRAVRTGAVFAGSE